jgi:hypothetical protein
MSGRRRSREKPQDSKLRDFLSAIFQESPSIRLVGGAPDELRFSSAATDPAPATRDSARRSQPLNRGSEQP